MSRKVRMEDVAEFSAWYFGTDLARRPRSTRRQLEAVRCAGVAGRELGFTWSEVADGMGRERTTVIYALSNGHQPDPDDVAAVLEGAKRLAEAAVMA